MTKKILKKAAQVTSVYLLAMMITLSVISIPGCSSSASVKAYKITDIMATAVFTGMTIYGQEYVVPEKVSPELQVQVKKVYEDYQKAARLAVSVQKEFLLAQKIGNATDIQTKQEALFAALSELEAIYTDLIGLLNSLGVKMPSVLTLKAQNKLI